MASLGAKVMQVRSIELAMVHNVRIFVRSSFDKPEDIDPHLNQPPGTLICDESEIMEQQVVTGIAFSKDEAQISIRHVPDKPGRRGGDLRPAGGGQHQCRHDRAERLGRRRDHRPDLHGPGRRLRARQRRDREIARRDRLRPSRHLDRRRQGLGDRHRHAQPCRRRREGLQGAGRAADQHPGDHHVGDQVLAADRCGLYRACGRTLHSLYGLDK